VSGGPRPAPALPNYAHKGIAGRVLAVCGSETMSGAAILVLTAAQRSGAGLVTLACFHRELLNVLPAAIPEAVYLDISRSKDLMARRLPAQLTGRADDVRVVGPGLGISGRTNELVRRLICDEFAGPLLLDADALNVIGDAPEVLCQYEGPLVVTPHPGEAARLLGCAAISPNSDERKDVALQIAQRSGSIVCLKGTQTVITDGKRVEVNETGNPGMATAGSGDVLCGVMSAYLASTVQQPADDWTAFDAARSAVHVHGLAGDLAAAKLGRRGMIASDIVRFLPEAQLRFEDEADGAR